MNPPVLTDHAYDRYRQRFDSNATRDHVAGLLHGARLQHQLPGGLTCPEPAEAYAINGEAVFPVEESRGGTMVAVTCLRRRCLSKADRRALREWARDDEYPEVAA